MPRRLVIYLMACGTVFLWGASFPLTKIALAWVGPTAIAFLRWIISAATLLGWLAVRRQLTALGGLFRRDGGMVAWVALTGITLFYFLENLALHYTTAINAGVLANLTSVFIVLIGVAWLRERLKAVEWLALGVAFFGAAMVSQGSGHLTLTGSGLEGDILMIVATFFGAVYSVGGKRLVARHSAEVVTAGVATIGTLFLLPLAVWETVGGGYAIPSGAGRGVMPVLGLPLEAWGALLLLGVGSGTLANLWWLHLLGYTTASRASMALFMIPVVSTALAVVALHEPLTLTTFVGGVLVLVGIAVTQRDRVQNTANHRQA